MKREQRHTHYSVRWRVVSLDARIGFLYEALNAPLANTGRRAPKLNIGNITRGIICEVRSRSMRALLVLSTLFAAVHALQIDAAMLRTAPAAARCSGIFCGPAPAIAKPKTITRQKTGGPGGGGGGGAGAVQTAQPKLKRIVEDVPMWKVILLGDNEYEQDPVRAHS